MRNHTVSTAVETIATKKTQTRKAHCPCDPQFMMNCQERNRNWKGSASVLASMRWLLCGARKRDLTSMTVPEKKRYLQSYINHPARDLSPFRFTFNAKTISVSEKGQKNDYGFHLFEKLKLQPCSPSSTRSSSTEKPATLSFSTMFKRSSLGSHDELSTVRHFAKHVFA